MQARWLTSQITKSHVERALAWVDAAIATILAACGAWLVHISNEAAAFAVREGGPNIDSGAIEYLLALLYFLPNAAVFSLAACFMFRRWRGRWLIQVLAITWIAGSVLSVVFERELRGL